MSIALTGGLLTASQEHHNSNISDDTCLHVAATTWARDSHELFDYEARHVHKKSFFLKRAAKIFRTGLEVEILPDGYPLPAQPADFLVTIRQRDGRYIIMPADKSITGVGVPPIMPKKLWLIVKELPNKHHQLQESDVIKLGRFKLRVKQLVKAGSTLPELRLDDVETPHSTVTAEDAATMQCRICLLDGGTAEDPLVCPCQCKGSIKFVHLDCLRHWINGRLSITDESQQKASFFFKQLHCELCKTPFPSAVILNNERVAIVKVPKIEAPFIILEHITANRGLHVISMGSRKELKLGRGHESDVRIADVSISRYHATIRFADGEFVLEDHNSKFGTLVSLRKLQAVEPSHSLVVQVGRTVLNLSLRSPPCDFEDVKMEKESSQPKTDSDVEDDTAGGPPTGPPGSGNPGNLRNNNAAGAGDRPIGGMPPTNVSAPFSMQPFSAHEILGSTRTEDGGQSPPPVGILYSRSFPFELQRSLSGFPPTMIGPAYGFSIPIHHPSATDEHVPSHLSHSAMNLSEQYDQGWLHQNELSGFPPEAYAFQPPSPLSPQEVSRAAHNAYLFEPTQRNLGRRNDSEQLEVVYHPLNENRPQPNNSHDSVQYFTTDRRGQFFQRDPNVGRARNGVTSSASAEGLDEFDFDVHLATNPAVAVPSGGLKPSALQHIASMSGLKTGWAFGAQKKNLDLECSSSSLIR